MSNINTNTNVETTLSEDVQFYAATAMAWTQEVATDVASFAVVSAQRLANRQPDVWAASKKRADDIWSRI